MNLGAAAAKLKEGEPVTFVARGQSMTPLVNNGETVTLRPRTGNVRSGDIVLANVNGRWYLHKVAATKDANGRQRCLIANNHGRINGWTGIKNVAGILA